MSQNDNYFAVMLEEIRDQNKAVIEAVGLLQDKVKTLATEDGLCKVETKIDTIQTVIKYNNRDLATLDGRVTSLEQAN